MKKPPCEKDCPRRSGVPNCHSYCEAYKEYKAAVSKEQAIINKATQEIVDYYEASPNYRKHKWGGGLR